MGLESIIENVMNELLQNHPSTRQLCSQARYRHVRARDRHNDGRQHDGIFQPVEPSLATSNTLAKGVP